MSSSTGSSDRPLVRSSPQTQPTMIDRLRSLADKVTGAFVRKRSNERPVEIPLRRMQRRPIQMRGVATTSFRPAGQGVEVVKPSPRLTPRNTPSPRRLQSPIPGPSIVGSPRITHEGPVPTRAEVVKSRQAHDEYYKRRGRDLIGLRHNKYEDCRAEYDKLEDEYKLQLKSNPNPFEEVPISEELEEALYKAEVAWKDYERALRYKTTTALLAKYCERKERELGEPLKRRPYHFREPGIAIGDNDDAEELYGIKVINMGYDPFIPRESEREYKERLEAEKRRAEEEGARMHAEAEGARIQRDLRSWEVKQQRKRQRRILEDAIDQERERQSQQV